MPFFERISKDDNPANLSKERNFIMRLFLRQNLSARVWLGLFTIIAALLLAFIPLPRAWVERFYTNGFYLTLQPLLTSFTNLLPFALGDVLLVAVLIAAPVWWSYRIRKAGKGRRLRALPLLFFHTLVLTAAIFLLFEILWGLNYLREPLVGKLEYDNQRLSVEALGLLRRTTIENLNAISGEVRAGDWPSDEEMRRMLAASFNRVVVDLGDRSGITPGVAKTSILNPYFKTTGIEGFTNPFGLEVILNAELLPIEKPFTLAHEWGHLAGFADEGEANFVALLSCLRSESAAVRYSGWLALYMYLPRRSEEENTTDAPLQLAPQVIADLRAISERVSRGLNQQASRMQSEMYDRFLKANRVQAGIASYGLFVRLVLGTRFEPDWVPARRQ